MQGVAVASGSSSTTSTRDLRQPQRRRAGHHHHDAGRTGQFLPVRLDLRRPGQPDAGGEHHRERRFAHPQRHRNRVRRQRRLQHYVYQSVTGNESISALVTTASGAAAKTQDGLMMRASASPTAPMYSVYLNPGGSAIVKWRLSDGIAYNHSIPITTSTSPAYLEIIRWQDNIASPAGTYFSTLTSADGVTWTPVLGSSVLIDMGSGSYLAGLAATSGTTGATTSGDVWQHLGRGTDHAAAIGVSHRVHLRRHRRPRGSGRQPAVQQRELDAPVQRRHLVGLRRVPLRVPAVPVRASTPTATARSASGWTPSPAAAPGCVPAS